MKCTQISFQTQRHSLVEKQDITYTKDFFKNLSEALREALRLWRKILHLYDFHNQLSREGKESF